VNANPILGGGVGQISYPISAWKCAQSFTLTTKFCCL